MLTSSKGVGTGIEGSDAPNFFSYSSFFLWPNLSGTANSLSASSLEILKTVQMARDVYKRDTYQFYNRGIVQSKLKV